MQVPPKQTIEQLLKKYDVPVPRYTSYPTVPHWDTESFSAKAWEESVKQCFDETNATTGISLYIHLPFCESLCTYCACNTRITKNHGVEKKYIESVLKEWNQYLQIFREKPVLRELHLGGGTPTFFSPGNLEFLLQGILQTVSIHNECEFGFEGHPNNTTQEHLEVLYANGFRRVSYGVQDLTEKVQLAINRFQPFENVVTVTELSRHIGYESVNFDLVYGLPHQTVESIEQTIEKVLTLRPDRIAFYSYAHVPWIRPGQRGYEDADLPGDVAKRALYERGKRLLEQSGYKNIGMDHFALPDDSLALAQSKGMLHRNFMGYTTSNTDLLIGLGTSAISDAKYAYAQNLKKVEDYHQKIEEGDLAVFKGHYMTDEDMIVRQSILDIACNGKLDAGELQNLKNFQVLNELYTMQRENLIEISTSGLIVTDIGRKFIRNICSVLDLRMQAYQQTGTQIFSKAI